MNLFELIWAVVALICGAAAATYLIKVWGLPGGVIGFLFGILVPFLLAKIFALLNRRL